MVLIILKLKKLTVIFIPILFLYLMPTAHAQIGLSTSAKSCVLMYEDGSTIYEKNADDKSLIASTTKIMTAIVCLENADLSDVVNVKAEHCAVEGSSMYLKAGEKYTVKELLQGLLLASGNDAALALADHISGTSREFVALMNDKAEELGMNNSRFANPHGLDAKEHYSTARDMAKLMFYCMDNQEFKDLVSCYCTTIKGNSYTNHNKLLKIYPGCIGGKTGFTSAAGRCLVTCCEKNGIRLVCVTLADADDWNDHMKLYDYVYENYDLWRLNEEVKYEIPLVSGSRESIAVVPMEEFEILIPQNEKIEIKTKLPQFVFAPVKIGETAGEICVIIKNKAVAQIPLVYAEGAVMAYPCLNMPASKGAI